MGHGKETPRQKMIGMMYLVLTALLALNVSKDVLNSFVLVNNGLTKTNANYQQKNDVIYGEFERAAAENEKKAGPWLAKANEIRTKANALFDQMEGLKREIIAKGDGEDSKALVRKNEIVADSISVKDNTDKPAEIMIGDNNDGKAFGLKASINEFRELLLGMIGEEGESVKSAIEKTLETNDPPAVEGKKEAWENEHFEHLPLIAVVTILSGLQNNVRNAETEILNYLYSQIDAGSFKFNKLEAVVIPKSDYVIKGNTYEAKVFIAASDTTQDPKILIGNYKEIPGEEGSVDYEMVGGYNELPVEKGIGVYKAGGSSIGPKKWGGLIVLKSPKGGADIKRPFKSEYMVEEPSMTVSPTKMNVFYVGLDNDVEISVSGVAADKVSPSISNGKISKVSGNKYIVNPLKQGNCLVRVIADMDGTKKDMGFKEFRVKLLPTPVAKVAGQRGGGVLKANLIAATGIVAEMENFEFAVNARVTSFRVSARIGGSDQEAICNGNKFSDEVKGIIAKVQKGGKIFFEEIKASLPDGSVRDLGSVILKVN
jgi:gliding motility-associated protein GldM